MTIEYKHKQALENSACFVFGINLEQESYSDAERWDTYGEAERGNCKQAGKAVRNPGEQRPMLRDTCRLWKYGRALLRVRANEENSGSDKKHGQSESDI